MSMPLVDKFLYQVVALVESKLKPMEATISKRQLLSILYQMSADAQEIMLQRYDIVKRKADEDAAKSH